MDTFLYNLLNEWIYSITKNTDLNTIGLPQVPAQQQIPFTLGCMKTTRTFPVQDQDQGVT